VFVSGVCSDHYVTLWRSLWPVWRNVALVFSIADARALFKLTALTGGHAVSGILFIQLVNIDLSKYRMQIGLGTSVHFEVNCVTTRPRCTSCSVLAHRQKFIFKRHDCIMVIVPCLLVRTSTASGVLVYKLLWNVQVPRILKAITVWMLSDVCPMIYPVVTVGYTMVCGCAYFRRVSWNSEKRLLDSSCLCVCLSLYISSAPSGRIFMKFGSGDLKENPWRDSRFS
jgi:hypothetical protein